MKTHLATLVLILSACGDSPLPTTGEPDPMDVSLNACRKIEQLPTTRDYVAVKKVDKLYSFTRNSTWDEDGFIKNETIDFSPYCTVVVDDGVPTVAYPDK